MLMTIPQVRSALLELRTKLLWQTISGKSAAGVIAHLETQLYRRPAIRKAPPQKRALSRRERAEIHAYVITNPDETYEDVAHRFNTSMGRVSEIMNGKRA